MLFDMASAAPLDSDAPPRDSKSRLQEVERHFGRPALRAVSAIFFAHDPASVGGFGVPFDEYDYEAEVLLHDVMKMNAAELTCDRVAKMVEDIFTALFAGVDVSAHWVGIAEQLIGAGLLVPHPESANRPPFSVGDRVALLGLQHSPELNMCIGDIVDPADAQGRYGVKLVLAPSRSGPEVLQRYAAGVRVRSVNLELAARAVARHLPFQ